MKRGWGWMGIGTAAVLCFSVTWAQTDHERDRRLLLEGVQEIAAPGIPGPLMIYSDSAFGVVVGQVEKDKVYAPVIAAGAFGEGRVVAFGHTGYFDSDALKTGDTSRLMRNAVQWAAKASESKKIRVGVLGGDGLAQHLREHGIDASALTGNWTRTLSNYDALCLSQGALQPAHIEAVRGFLKSGGGAVLCGLAWGWLQLNPGKTIDQNAGNQLLSEAGLGWADGYLEKTSRLGFDAKRDAPKNSHARIALETLRQGESGQARSNIEKAQAAWSAMNAISNLPPDDRLLLPQARQLASNHSATLIPTAKTPLKSERHLERFLVAYQLQSERSTPPKSIRAHPAAASFPGEVAPGAKSVSRTLRIKTGMSGWHSTGLYAPAGGLLIVSLSDEAAKAGLSLQIGCHSDTLWHLDSWRRFPDIVRVFPLNAARVEAASAFGGLIYVVSNGRGAGEAEITISGAVNAPHFVLGETTLQAWRETIRHYPAPWAELESGKVIVSVPSSTIRDLEDPESVMKFWDMISDAHATLGTIPLQPPRPHRFVADEQISAGYMHSGYPIMTHLDAAETMSHLAPLKQGAWGLLHELGHNHQVGDWTFEGTGEVTCNLFALHAIDTICEPPTGSRGHPGVDKPPSFEAFRERGSPFNEWKSDPFLALQMYIQLEKAFGWETYKKVFAEYRALPANARPRNDAEKRDQWMVRFSRACGRNLGPFFQAWGIPVSERALKSIEDLPVWMP